MFEQYRGRAGQERLLQREFLTMADLAGTVDKDKPVDVESGYAELTVDLPPGKHYDFQKGSTVVLMMQDMVRRTSAHDVEMRNSYQYTLLTNLTVLDVGTSIGDGTIARPQRYAKDKERVSRHPWPRCSTSARTLRYSPTTQ